MLFLCFSQRNKEVAGRSLDSVKSGGISCHDAVLLLLPTFTSFYLFPSVCVSTVCFERVSGSGQWVFNDGYEVQHHAALFSEQSKALLDWKRGIKAADNGVRPTCRAAVKWCKWTKQGWCQRVKQLGATSKLSFSYPEFPLRATHYILPLCKLRKYSIQYLYIAHTVKWTFLRYVYLTTSTVTPGSHCIICRITQGFRTIFFQRATWSKKTIKLCPLSLWTVMRVMILLLQLSGRKQVFPPDIVKVICLRS